MKISTLTKAIAGGVAMSALLAGAAFADGALVYDGGGKFDKSFNEAAYNGAEKFKAEGGAYQDLEISGDAQREQAVRQFASRGNNPIVLPGFSWETALRAVAPDFPDTKFTIIDTVVDLPNVQSVVFEEPQGSYLVGILAAMQSKSGKVGVIPAFNFDLLDAFACGYAQGAKSVNPDIEVIKTYVGTGFEAFNDPGKATEVAKSQLDQGVDVVFQVAGGAGAGVLQAAADAGKWSIGVDSNQNHLHPGSVLTSMLKRVDVAAYNAMKGVEDGTWAPGLITLGLAEEGVGAAFDDNNASLITPEMKAAVEKATADIISGAVVVHDSRTDKTCPAL
ncbi:BMP family ABC transporter substrate-binding protein [Devosia sp. MC532]|nr:BMP family ABC transporter substrate-binding protein [Devosia sp. MC521]MBJ7579063.1 BMP family ABC transporter substrate-binding protein [Devosia sp. MC532]MBK1795911.1 BMP family ABC transporter substrate-binding protein [Devosia sp. WQ 349K1]QMW63049.1 BMP family ABC transporter substrate-binding protein [Devosia sp. MC521]